MDSDFKPARRPAKSLRNTDIVTPATKTQNLEPFQTPEEVAAKDSLLALDKLDEKVSSGAPPRVDFSAKKSLLQKIKDFRPSWPPGKKEWVGSLIIILVCGTLTAFILNRTEPTPVSHAAPKIVKKAAPKPTTVASNLTGLQVDPAINAKPVTGVMIENSMDARPQSGLSDAGVVFEAIAEGGITRFMALFQDTNPADVGPIRSARPYYVQWAMGFDAGYAHVGGSPEALANIKAWGARDLDQFYNGGSYHRISSRAAPHNVYTAIDALQQLEASKGYSTSTYTGLVRTKKANPSKTPAAKSINMSISGPLYNAHYDYNPATNTYNRSEGGAPHMDANGNRQISPTVVVAIVVPYTLESDGYHSQYQAIGSGQAFIFQDGNVTTGTWSKTDNKTQLTFTDAAGKPIGLNPGQTWITAVSDATKVSYSP
jgi:hypothetical protein